MRDIRFKAKRLDTGEWVEGNLIRNRIETRDPEKAYLSPVQQEHCWIVGDMLESWEDYSVLESWNPVDPATVCQFTGLSDADGFEIYEGDILGDVKDCIVTYSELECNFFLANFNGDFVDYLAGFNGVKIGNIHDESEGEG